MNLKPTCCQAAYAAFPKTLCWLLVPFISLSITEGDEHQMSGFLE